MLMAGVALRGINHSIKSSNRRFFSHFFSQRLNQMQFPLLQALAAGSAMAVADLGGSGRLPHVLPVLCIEWCHGMTRLLH